MKVSVVVSFISIVVLGSGCVFESFEPVGIYAPIEGDASMNDGGDEELDATTPDTGTDAGPADMGTDAGGDAGDAGEPVDMDNPVDMPPDMGCSDTVTTPPLTSGDVCQPVNGITPGLCDPVDQSGCPNGQMCDLQLVFSDGMPSGFATQCIPYRCESRTKLEGDSCAAGQCQPGYKCNQGICKRYCQLSDSLGCAEGQGCAGSSLAREYGLCQPSC